MGRLDSSNCLKGTLLKKLSRNFPKLSKQQFFRISPENCMKRLGYQCVKCITCLLSSSNTITSNDSIVDLFLANLQLFRNTQRKHFSWSLFAEAVNSRLPACNIIKEKETVL